MPDPDLTGLDRFSVYPNQGLGMGHGITERLELPEGYDRAVNMRDVHGRMLTPAFDHVVKQALVGKQPPVAMPPWYDSSLVPVLIVLQDTGVKIFKNGALTTEADATTAEYASAEFFDDGTNALLIAGTKTGSKLLNKRTQAGSWTESGSRLGVYVAEAAGALFASINDYQVVKYAAGSDPTSAAPSNTYRVGHIDAKINSVGAIEDKIIVGKEDGLWRFVPDGGYFTRFLVARKHQNNFKFLKPDGQGGLYTAEDTGDIVHIQRFGAVIVTNVLRNKSPWRDTPHGPIVDIEIHADKVILLMDGGYKTSQNAGLVVAVTQDGGTTYTIYDTELSDQRLDTAASISSLDTEANGDWILIGTDVPHFGLDITMGTVNTANARITWRRVSGFGGGGTGMTTSTTFPDFHDGTDTTPATTSTPLGQSGRLMLKPTNVNIGTWVAEAVTLNGDTESRTKYWSRIGLN